MKTGCVGAVRRAKQAIFFFMNTGMLAVLGMECWTPCSTKFGQRKLLPFSIMNRHSHSDFFFLPRFSVLVIYTAHQIFLIVPSFFLHLSPCICCSSLSLSRSFFLSFHSSHMSLQFNLLYCCNKFIHLFGQSSVNCRQMNICCTIYFTFIDQ